MEFSKISPAAGKTGVQKSRACACRPMQWVKSAPRGCHAARTPSSRGLAAHVNASSSQASRTHHDRGMSAVPALAAPGRVEARHRSCMPHACSRHACIASSVAVGLAARHGHMGGSWSGPSSHRCAQARGSQPLKHRAKQPSTGHPRCRQARARADTGGAQHKHRSSTGAEMVWCGLVVPSSRPASTT